MSNVYYLLNFEKDEICEISFYWDNYTVALKGINCLGRQQPSDMFGRDFFYCYIKDLSESYPNISLGFALKEAEKVYSFCKRAGKFDIILLNESSLFEYLEYNKCVLFEEINDNLFKCIEYKSNKEFSQYLKDKYRSLRGNPRMVSNDQILSE